MSQPLRIEKGRNSNSLLIKLKEFPEYDFRAGGMTLQETYYSDLMKDFREGDVIDLTIEKKIYDKKISKKKELTYWDLIYHFRKIHVVKFTAKISNILPWKITTGYTKRIVGKSLWYLDSLGYYLS